MRFVTPSARSSRRQRDQVVIVHPDQVVGPQQRLSAAANCRLTAR